MLAGPSSSWVACARRVRVANLVPAGSRMLVPDAAAGPAHGVMHPCGKELCPGPLSSLAQSHLPEMCREPSAQEADGK